MNLIALFTGQYYLPLERETGEGVSKALSFSLVKTLIVLLTGQ